MDSLAEIIRTVRSALELKRKSPIGGAVARLANPAGESRVKAGMGEDAGAIRVRGGYILLTADGIWPQYRSLTAKAATGTDLHGLVGRFP